MVYVTPRSLRPSSIIKRLAFFCLAVTMPLSLTSCGWKEEKAKEPPYRIVQMGNVMNIIKDTENDPSLPLSFFRSLDSKEIYLGAVSRYQSVGKYRPGRPKTMGDIERENSSYTKRKSGVFQRQFEVQYDEGAGKIALLGANPLTTISLEFDFTASLATLNDETLTLGLPMKIIAGEVSGPASLIHFSLSPDSKFFTLLIYVPGEKGSGSEIIALIFSTSWRLNIEPRGNSEYIYLRGPGTAAPWDTKKPLNIEICGNNIPRSEIVDIQKGIEVWLPYISNATQNRWAIKIHETKNGILPFTDFSQHCIFVIDDFLMEPDPRLGTFGITTSVIDSSASQIIDSDVMIFRGEFKKFNSSASPSEIYRAQKITAIHEMGHFFGLGHQFNGEASVMSYKFKDLSPTKYDIDAITELYKQ